MIEIPYGAQRWDKYGYNSDIQSAEECITPQYAPYYPEAALRWKI